MIVIDNKFDIGSIVYLKTDPDQRERVVVGIKQVCHNIIYILALGINESSHYDIEISVEKNVLMQINSQ